MSELDIRSKRVALFSDIHWGKSRDSETKLNATRRFIEEFLAYLMREDINDVIFLGDWYDNRNFVSVKTINYAYEALKRFDDAGINVYMIVGNHDSYFKDTITVNSVRILADIPSIHPVEEQTVVRFGDRTGLMVPWDAYDPEPEVRHDVMFGHFDFQGAKLKGMTNQTGATATELLAAAPLVFSGHFHLRNSYSYRDGRIVTVGCPLELDWGDFENPKG